MSVLSETCTCMNIYCVCVCISCDIAGAQWRNSGRSLVSWEVSDQRCPHVVPHASCQVSIRPGPGHQPLQTPHLGAVLGTRSRGEQDEVSNSRYENQDDWLGVAYLGLVCLRRTPQNGIFGGKRGQELNGSKRTKSQYLTCKLSIPRGGYPLCLNMW